MASITIPSVAVPHAGRTRLRPTRRGLLTLRAAVVLLALLTVAAGVLVDRPAQAGDGPPSVVVSTRTVLPGETLWSIAAEVAPEADRRETVELLAQLNDLTSTRVRSGQRLLVPAGGSQGP